MKTRNIFKENIERFIKRLSEFNDSDEAFVSSLSSPSFEEALMQYLNKFDIELKSEEIKIHENPIDIDSDGYPFIIAYVEIRLFKLSFQCITYHHDYWDFYVENLTCEQMEYNVSTLKKVLADCINEDYKIQVDKIDDIVDEYHIDDKNVYVKVDEGVLTIPYYSTYQYSLGDIYNALDIEEAFLTKDKSEWIKNIIDEHKKIAKFLEESLN